VTTQISDRHIPKAAEVSSLDEVLQVEAQASEDQYRIKLEVFEGPLDLLLYLIRKEEVSIYDIPIARITEQYLEHLRAMQEMDIGVAGEFLVMAATLIHIKSQMLLPRDPELAKLPAGPRKFRAHRSLRDVEPGVPLWLKRLDGMEIPPEEGD